MVPESPRCTVDILNSFELAKTKDVGKTYGLCYHLLKNYIVALLLDILLVAWV
jgi:hypothetical protein